VYEYDPIDRFSTLPTTPASSRASRAAVTCGGLRFSGHPFGMIHLLVTRDVTSRTSTPDPPLVRNGKAPYWTRVVGVAFTGLRINTIAQVTRLPWFTVVRSRNQAIERMATAECFRRNSVNVGCWPIATIGCIAAIRTLVGAKRTRSTVGRSRCDAGDPRVSGRVYLECLRSTPTQPLYSEPSSVAFGSKASNSVGPSGSGVDIRLRLTGVNPNSEAS
jgi:hypothetical protein